MYYVSQWNLIMVNDTRASPTNPTPTHYLFPFLYLYLFTLFYLYLIVRTWFTHPSPFYNILIGTTPLH